MNLQCQHVWGPSCLRKAKKIVVNHLITIVTKTIPKKFCLMNGAKYCNCSGHQFLNWEFEKVDPKKMCMPPNIFLGPQTFSQVREIFHGLDFFCEKKLKHSVNKKRSKIVQKKNCPSKKIAV